MKRCRTCKSKFEPFNSLHVVCGPVCALQYAQKEKIKAAEGRAKDQRKWVKEQKERLKSRGDHAREAQKEFNAFIRARDEHLPCISCESYTAGQYHAGHYRTVKAAPELRYDEATSTSSAHNATTSTAVIWWNIASIWVRKSEQRKLTGWRG